MRLLNILAMSLATSTVALAAGDPEPAGIGLALGTEGRHVIVRAILPGSPAEASRALRVGDRLLEVAQDGKPGVSVVGKSIEDAVKLIRGPRGTTVHLTVAPPGADRGKARVVLLVRGTVKELSRWGDGERLAPGSKAPDIAMLRLAGKAPARLSEHSGKVIVLEFWSTYCAPCQPLVAALQRYPETHPSWAGKVALITASVDEDADAALKHLTAKGWDKTLNVQVDSDALKAFHINCLPTVYVIDPRGAIATMLDAEDLPATVDRLLREE